MDYSTLEFNSRDVADFTLSAMRDILEKYGVASVCDLYDLGGMPSTYAHTKIGWDNLESALVFENRSGTYSIRFPMTKDISGKSRKVTTSETEDVVNHPSHYQSQSGLETIQVIDAFTADLVGTEAVCTGNVLKYICRWKHKNGLQDLEKAKWYLEHLINHIKNNEKESE